MTAQPALRQLAKQLVGAVDWVDEHHGFCRCPAEDLHTNPTGPKDCKVHLDQVPTIHCFHESCATVVADINYRLRCNADRARPAYQPTPQEQQRLARRHAERAAKAALQRRARKSLDVILREDSTGPYDFWEESPISLSWETGQDWQGLLRLFAPDDIIWIGEKTDSCGDDKPKARKTACREHFKTRAEWLELPAAPAPFICASTFKAGSYSRSNCNVVHHRFLVVESDKLDRYQVTGVFNYMRKFSRLRALVDTGNKSLHGWFDMPPAATITELKVILPELGCDPALFNPSQPVRLPGWLRSKDESESCPFELDERVQHLVYLDPNRR